MWPYNVTNFFIIKPNRCTNFPDLLRHETLHVSSSSSSHHQEFIHCTLGTAMCHTGLKRAFEQDQGVPSRYFSTAVFKPVWHIPVPSVQWINSWWWAEELPETCRVSWRSKFVKLVYLVGFIIKEPTYFECCVCVDLNRCWWTSTTWWFSLKFVNLCLKLRSEIFKCKSIQLFQRISHYQQPHAPGYSALLFSSTRST